MNFAVNVLGTYGLTELLLPLLEKSQPDGRVITVSSGGMYTAPLTNDLQVALKEKWAEKYGNRGIGFYAMHPGWAETPGVTNSMLSFSKSLQGKPRTSEEGADTVIWLVLQPKEKLVSGGFYFDRTEAPKHLAFAATKNSHVAIDSIIATLDLLGNFSM